MPLVHAYQILYYTQHVNFQIRLFNKVVADIDFWETTSRETELFYNKSYQKQVEHRLKFCIERFQEFVKIYIVKIREIDILVAAFAICGVLIGIGISFCMSSNNLSPGSYLRMSAIALLGSTTFSAIIWSGQSFETLMAELIATLSQIRWYNFNGTNKKLYLIFLTNIMKEHKIKFTENYSINYQLGLAIVRGIYSIASVAVKMRS
ncbi:uncharacterized protein LOC123014854 [Tribolium madens]|uniref:uncharacterized protein LOC123014854 n=1 Tax=Tribolium madens TaxID=41895 RepID=UPI001CF7324B|nr:uncharacterized protein LOC123014854 [Tribolium madens]